jgi:uroporphyrinogen decarboxylase
MAEITGRERIIAAMKRTYADCIPVGLMLGAFRAALLDCSLKEYWTDGKKLAEGTLLGYERFGHDAVEISWDIMMEAETAGAELEFRDDAVPQVKRYVLAEKKNLGKLTVPDPEKAGRYPLYLEACRNAARTLKGPNLAGTVTGPWTTATGLRGAQELIFDTVDDPGFVDDLMAFTTEVVKALGGKLLETGISVSMGEAACSCSLISPALYRRFVKPRHEELVRFFAAKKKGLSLHVCGYIDPIMEDLVSLGISALSLDSPSSLEKMIQVSRKKIALLGNVATTLFVQGTKEEIETAVKNCIRTAAPGGAYILSSGCELPHNATPDRVSFYMEAAREFGRADKIPSP